MVTDVLLVSDIHIGRRTASYDVYRSKLRMKRLIRSVYKVGRSSGARRVAVCMLGDIVDGEEVYAGQGYEVDGTIDVMMDIAVDGLGRLLEKLGECYDVVKTYCVYGNHGRANRRASKTANWDLVVYQRLQERFGESMVKISRRFWMEVDVEGYNMLLMHGDNIRMYHQIPYYGIVQQVMRYNLARQPIGIVCLGHFHHLFSLWYNDVYVFGNGTFLTDDDYSLRMGLRPSNAFWMFGVSDKKGVVWQVPVRMC